MFNKLKTMAIEKRLEDQILYEYVLDELEAGIKIKGLWGKAYANSEGDNNKIEPLYMQYRVQSIKDLFTAMKIMYESLSKEQIKEYLIDNYLTDEEKEEKKRQEERLQKEKLEHQRLLEEKRKIEEEKERIESIKQAKQSAQNFIILSIIVVAIVGIFMIFK